MPKPNLRRYIDAAWKDLTIIGLSPNAFARSPEVHNGFEEKRLADADLVQEKRTPNGRTSRSSSSPTWMRRLGRIAIIAIEFHPD